MSASHDWTEFPAYRFSNPLTGGLTVGYDDFCHVSGTGVGGRPIAGGSRISDSDKGDGRQGAGFSVESEKGQSLGCGAEVFLRFLLTRGERLDFLTP